MGPPWLGSSRYGYRYSMSRTCGPQDIISLVIPRLGDNMAYNTFSFGMSLLHMTKFAMFFCFYCHTYLLHFPWKQRLFFMEIFSSLYPRTRYSWKQRWNNPSTCHHPQDRFTLKSVAIETKLRHNRDKNPCQSKNITNILWHKFHMCNAKAWKVVTKKHGNRDEKFWQRK